MLSNLTISLQYKHLLKRQSLWLTHALKYLKFPQKVVNSVPCPILDIAIGCYGKFSQGFLFLLARP